MNNAQVSIIIPLYNAAGFMQKCINSIMQQTYQYFEAILVDDGSTDDTVEKALEFISGDSRFKLVQQNNSGPGVARNHGLHASKGQFICFVDSDDYLDPDAIQQMLDAFASEVDIIQCKSQKVYLDDTMDTEPWCDHECVLTKEEAMSDYLYNSKPIVRFSVWAKMYRKTILENVSFPEMNNSEDVVFNARAISRSKRIKYINKTLYYAVVREGSLTHTKVTEKKIKSSVTCSRMITEIVDGEDVFIGLRGRAYWTLILTGINCLNQMRQWDDTKRRKVSDEVIAICRSMRYPFHQFSLKENAITRLFLLMPYAISKILMPFLN